MQLSSDTNNDTIDEVGEDKATAIKFPFYMQLQYCTESLIISEPM